MLCNTYAQTDNGGPAKDRTMFTTHHDYHTVDEDFLNKKTTENKYGDCVMVQRQSSSALSGGHPETLDFSLTHNFPKHLHAHGLIHPGQLSVMPGPFSSSHVEEFCFLPKTNNQRWNNGGILPAQSIILPPPVMCQLPKHILASQVRFASTFTLFYFIYYLLLIQVYFFKIEKNVSVFLVMFFFYVCPQRLNNLSYGIVYQYNIYRQTMNRLKIEFNHSRRHVHLKQT